MAYMAEGLNSVDNHYPGTTQEASGKLRRAGESIGNAAGKTIARSRGLATLVRDRAETIKEEKPLQILAVVGVVAAIVGFAIRLWRASNNA
mgnify:CR=1 FL=1